MHIPYLKEDEILKYDYCFFIYGSISRKLINIINKKENILVILMDNQITINEKNIDYCKNVALRKFTLQALPFYVRQNSEYKAYKAIDDVYEALRHKSGIPQKTLTNMYKDKQVELAYKRFVIDCIKNVFILDNVLQQLNDHNIQFDIFANLRLYKSIHWFNGKNERFFLSNIRIKHVKYNGFFLIDKILHNMMWSIRMLILPFYILLKARRIDIFKKTKDIKMAILVFSSDWRLSDNSLIPSVDWPINNKELDATNTIFVSELSLDSEYKEQFNRRNYVYEDLSTFNRQNLFFIFSKLLYLSTTNLLNIFKDAVYGDKLLLEVSVKGIYVFYQWSLFSLYWNTKKTLCYQGGGYRDIFRNIVLRKHNCESWRYDHTFNFNFNIYDNSVGVPEPTTELAFLNYTYEMHWGALNTSAFLSSKSHSINHLTTLPVWQYVFDSVSKQDIKDVIREKIPDKGKIISAFNSSFTHGSYNGLSNHLSFLKLLNRLFESSLNKNHDITLLIKGKYPLEKYYELNNGELNYELDLLLNNDSVININNKISSTAIINVSDLVLSMSYTGTSIEALTLRKRAIYFDYNLSYPESILLRFNKMVATSIDECQSLIEYWIEMSDESFNKYLDNTFFPFYINGYNLEKDPLGRLRK